MAKDDGQGFDSLQNGTVQMRRPRVRTPDGRGFELAMGSSFWGTLFIFCTPLS